MSAKFYTLLTDIGAAKLASAAALGVPLKITQMAVGDGGGVLPTPSAQQTALVAEKRRASLNMLYIDPQNSSQIIAEQVIPETEGGWWIREVGLFDETGALIAVGNCPESYKPQLAEGSGRTQTVRMVLITSSTDNITLKIDPSVVLATRKYVDDKVLELKVYVDELMAAHLAAADPHTQYAPKVSPTFTGTPKAPTAAAGNNTTQLATTAFVQAALIALVNGAPATLDTLKEIAAAINNDPNFSTTINNALALKAPLASPALTGTPTAPTAAQTVNNTQIATTAFVKSALAALVGSSPAALDTLNELAAALGNDPNFATTMTNALAGKQPLDNTLTELSGKSVAELLNYLDLGALQATFTDKSGKIALNGGWGLGIKADQTTGTMAALDVSRFDYFAPADNIGPYPGQWAGGISFANSGSTGWQICGASLGSIPDFSVRIKTSQTAFSNWYKLYHTGFKPTPADINAIQRDACDVAGFISNNQQDPYMRHSASQNLIQLATRQFVSQSISSLSLGTAATKNVGTGAGQIPDMSSFTSGTGWASLPGGTIIQWGIAASGQIGNPQTINFPVPFTNYSTVQLVASYDNAGASAAPYSFAAQPISNTQFKLLNSITSSAVIYARWIAIGR
ncbi:phage tail protein [Enterobacter hormaechei]|uniref:phage tail protein n=2 Tax=Enterobacter cloacae complex TaxID=354276 RepID=UPI0022DD66B0|nr:phage tail protein [Enterobacter hormaechei]WBM57460.1 phage tail protein [Enterobacter hormaechei]